MRIVLALLVLIVICAADQTVQIVFARPSWIGQPKGKKSNVPVKYSSNIFGATPWIRFNPRTELYTPVNISKEYVLKAANSEKIKLFAVSDPHDSVTIDLRELKEVAHGLPLERTWRLAEFNVPALLGNQSELVPETSRQQWRGSLATIGLVPEPSLAFAALPPVSKLNCTAATEAWQGNTTSNPAEALEYKREVLKFVERALHHDWWSPRHGRMRYVEILTALKHYASEFYVDEPYKLLPVSLLPYAPAALRRLHIMRKNSLLIQSFTFKIFYEARAALESGLTIGAPLNNSLTVDANSTLEATGGHSIEGASNVADLILAKDGDRREMKSKSLAPSIREITQKPAIAPNNNTANTSLSAESTRNPIFKAFEQWCGYLVLKDIEKSAVLRPNVRDNWLYKPKGAWFTKEQKKMLALGTFMTAFSGMLVADSLNTPNDIARIPSLGACQSRHVNFLKTLDPITPESLVKVKPEGTTPEDAICYLCYEKYFEKDSWGRWRQNMDKDTVADLKEAAQSKGIPVHQALDAVMLPCKHHGHRVCLSNISPQNHVYGMPDIKCYCGKTLSSRYTKAFTVY